MSKFDVYSKFTNINSMNHKWNVEKIMSRHIMIKLLNIVIVKILKAEEDSGKHNIERRMKIRKRADFLSEPEDNEVLKENPTNLDKE